jgi:Spondin_N
MRRFLLLSTMLALAAAVAATPALARPDDGGTKRWRVTIDNLTPPGSQPLSPPVFAVHSRRADVWSVGEQATHGVAGVAEDANNGPLVSVLNMTPGVTTAFTGAGGPIMPGASASYTVESRGRFDRLSLVTMLVNTNDGFTGLDSLKLRGRGDVLLRIAYDAGSERNNELAAFIPGPCCGNPFVRDPEGALIRMHPGIAGVGDLDPAVYGWPPAVVRITIARVS